MRCAHSPLLAGRALPLLVALLAACPSAPTSDDQDGDGTPDALDCAPLAPQIHPGADDPYGDQFDSDCDGGDGVDADGDGYPSNVADDLAHRDLQDCDDSDPATHPDGDDLPGDGLDGDCDGVDGLDADQDGWASVATGGRDCDDAQAATNPGAPDPAGDGVDRDCDGTDGVDGDSDGVASAGSGGTDCDDDDPAVFPGAFDPCDGADTNCLSDPTERDDDGDGWLLCAGDCDDDDASQHPGATELCDGLDQDCDGGDDSLDADGDGARNCDGDCDDSDPQVGPNATERCNQEDDDCDGALPASERDLDGDGHIPCFGDCDDANATRFPGAWADPPSDGVDRDCDGADGPGGLASPSLLLAGTVARDRFGATVGSAGDVDGDGLSDLFLTAPGSGVIGPGAAAEGRIYLFLGSQLSAPGFPSDLLAADAHAVLRGESAFDAAGSSVHRAGDLDGDGRDELIVGAPGNDLGGANAGRVYVVLGSSLSQGGDLPLASAYRRWTGTAGDEAGLAVSGGADVTGDGVPDLLVGAHGLTAAGAWTGGAYLISGVTPTAVGGLALAARNVLNGERSGDFAGTSVDLGGDVDGDGRADLLVGAPTADGAAAGSGRAYVVRASTLPASGAYALASAIRLDGVSAGDGAGEVVAFAADLDGDARAEVIVGSPSAAPGGSVALWKAVSLPASSGSLAAASLRFAGTAAAPVGLAFATDADVDADGDADVLIGAGSSVRLYLAGGLPPSGAVAAAAASYSWMGAAGTTTAVGGAGDTDGDGRGDLVVGIRTDDAGTVPGAGALLRSPL